MARFEESYLRWSLKVENPSSLEDTSADQN